MNIVFEPWVATFTFVQVSESSSTKYCFQVVFSIVEAQHRHLHTPVSDCNFCCCFFASNSMSDVINLSSTSALKMVAHLLSSSINDAIRAFGSALQI